MKKIVTIIIIFSAFIAQGAQALSLVPSYYDQYKVGKYLITELDPGYRYDYYDYDYDSYDYPDVETEDVDDIEDDSVELNGEVDMNRFNDGIVFFVYGQDEDMIEDTDRDYNEYDDIKDDEEHDDFEVVRIDRDLDSQEDYSYKARNLEEDEGYYYRLCVEFEDNNRETIVCGNIEEFETDWDSSDTPDVDTDDVRDIDDDSAELRGDVDMNDFDNGTVFFVWGEDEDGVDDVEDEDEFDGINERGDDLQKYIVDNSLDRRRSYELFVSGLDDNTDIYFRICVEYDDRDETLECGRVEAFETD